MEAIRTDAAKLRAERAATPAIERLGQVALVTQGCLYVVIGLLAVQVATGDRDAKPGQRGAIESVARQPFGQVLLVVLIAGLAAHALWRLALAARGEPGPGDDSKSVVKRLANVGRSAIYVSLTAAAVRVLVNAASGSDAQQRSTALVLEWPAGPVLVIGVGLAVIAAGLWNMSKVVTARFLKHLDLAELDERQRRAVDVMGRVGYAARGVAFSLVGWFLVEAGLQHDPDESRSLDDSLRELSTTSHGPPILMVLAVGMVLFGSYRILDARFRKRSEITYS